MHYLEETGRILSKSFKNERKLSLSMQLNKQITLGYVLMFLLIVVISGFSIYNVYKLDKAASNIKGRYNTLSNLRSGKEEEKQKRLLSFENDMLVEAIKISDEQVKYTYINIFTIIGIAILFGGILTFIVPRAITKPIYRLVNAAKSVALGDYSYRVNDLNTSSSEINMLIKAFNAMLENIEYHHKELKKKNVENLNLLEETRRFNEVLATKIEEATREIKEKQKELLKSERLATIGEIATGIAHEIRNPLSGIAVALELMKDEAQNTEYKQTISDILKELERLERIIKELLQLASPRSLNLIECEPNEIVERALSIVRLKAEEKGISIEKRLNCTERFRVDPEQIQQVVINLIINGVEAMDNLGKLTIETENSDDYIGIKISDTGCGFTQDEQERIFQPFYSNKEYGTGLGLSISNRIVEIHKGKILASSEKGKGSGFTIMIPTNLTVE